jgi:hypothetical protein
MAARGCALIALYMMKHLRFSAREAMGWLRVMRPGSVIGEQQHYLCEVERGLLSRRLLSRRPRRPGRLSHLTREPLHGGT